MRGRCAIPADTRFSMQRVLVALLLGASLILLLYQVPATHVVDSGGYDAAYVQGFYDPQYADTPGGSQDYVQGSDGSVRWSRDQSFLVFPQAGLPATVNLRLRGWREDVPPPAVRVLLNGQDILATLQTSQEWQDYPIVITGGLGKVSDVVLELRSQTAALPDEGRTVGVLLDRATLRVEAGPGGLITPYPAQVIGGALVLALLWVWLDSVGRGSWRTRLLSAPVLGGVFLLLYRLQPPLYPYPLRGLFPTLLLLLLALLVLRHMPPLLEHHPLLLDGAALLVVLLWSGALLLAAHDHLTLSVPGVEKDFRVFATRTDSLDGVLQADGFYNLGYPFVLWLVRPLTAGNVFLAARLVAVASGALFLASGWWLARGILAQEPDTADTVVQCGGALLVVLVLALNPLSVEYALYIGSDMPFAALVTLSLALFVWGTQPARPGASVVLLVLAGVAAGCAFLVRHPGLVLLLWGIISCSLLRARRDTEQQHTFLHKFSSLATPALPFVAGFVLAALPQLVVNTLDTGQPLYSQQAKNIWLAVYGDVDWGRWNEVPDTIGLRDVVLHDPPRFLRNWWSNVVAFTGSGAEDTSEFGQALHLRLLAWPANWLAVVGVGGWLMATFAPARQRRTAARRCSFPITLTLLLFAALYVLVVCTAFVLPRFFLPLAPISAAAAGWAVVALVRWHQAQSRLSRTTAWSLLLAGFVLLFLLHDSVRVGTRFVLDHQPEDERAAVRLVLDSLPPGEQAVTHISPDVPIAKYSAAAHLLLPLPTAPDMGAALVLAQAQGISYLLWDEQAGQPPLPDPQAACVGSTGRYGLYRLATSRTE